MARKNKFRYLFVIQGCFGHGWEDVDETEDHRNAKFLVWEYRAAHRSAHRIIQRRELNV